MVGSLTVGQRIVTMTDELSEICTALKQKGFNLVGVADGGGYQTYLPDCQSAIVFANGGTDGWNHFVADIRAFPEHLSAHQHPLDDFVGRCIQQVDPNPPSSRRWIQCADTAELFVDFQQLGREAGLGQSSPVGLLVHPEYGLWVSLRMVLLTTELLESTNLRPHPCASCLEKPCIKACPSGAVTPQGWSVQTCASFHQTSTLCKGVCHSRLVCPVGSQHRHSQLQHLYHNARTEGRKQLAKELGIVDEQEGLDPNWSDWQ